MLAYLETEFEKNSNLQIGEKKLRGFQRSKESKNKVILDVHKFKYESSRGDSLFSSVDFNSGVKSTRGMNQALFVDQYTNFLLSRSLLNKAAIYENNYVRNFTNCIMKYGYKYRYNYLLKTSLGFLVFYNICKGNKK